MALVINCNTRNTFLHYSFDEQEDNLKACRSNSAPPTFRQLKGDSTSETNSTTCETFALESSAADSEDGVASCCSDNEHADISAPMTGYNTDTDSDDEPQPQNPVAATVSEMAAQEQLDQMSKMVMDIWEKLRSVEVVLDAQLEEAAAPKAAPSVAAPSVAAPRTPLVAAPVFVPGCSEAQSVLESVKQGLLLAKGVAGVQVNLGNAGTLATISMRLDSNASKTALIATAKSFLLDSAANSQGVYVMGYDAQPFQEDANGSGFSTALALCPPAWECSACWDIYQYGQCRRRNACKWQHPGRNELQPVRVVVH